MGMQKHQNQTRTRESRMGAFDWLGTLMNAVFTGTLFHKKDSDAEKRAVVEKMHRKYKASFSDVEEADPETLKSELLKGEKRIVLFDTRPEDERLISTIPGAVHELDPKSVQNGTEIICYCTVGYRSGLRAKELKKEVPEGTTVKNLRGGILLWTLYHGDIVNKDGEATKSVHVYGQPWNLVGEGFIAVIGRKGEYKTL